MTTIATTITIAITITTTITIIDTWAMASMTRGRGNIAPRREVERPKRAPTLGKNFCFYALKAKLNICDLLEMFVIHVS